MLRKLFAKPDAGVNSSLVVRKVEARREYLRFVCAPLEVNERAAVLARASFHLVWRRRPGAENQTQRLHLGHARHREGQDGQLLADVAAPSDCAQWISLKFEHEGPAAVVLTDDLRLQLANLLPEAGAMFQAVFARRANRIGGPDTQATLAQQILDDPGRPADERMLAATVQIYKAMESAPEHAWARGLQAFAAVQAEAEEALASPAVDTTVLMLILAQAQLVLGHGDPAHAQQQLMDLLQLASRARDPMTSAECVCRAALIVGSLQAVGPVPADGVKTLRRIPGLFREAVAAADPTRLREFENMRKLLQCATTAGHLWREIEKPTGQMHRLCTRTLEVAFNVAGKHRDSVFRRLQLAQPASSPRERE